MNNRKTAVEGEVLARQYLEDKGYKIIGTNIFCGKSEIDIIAEYNNIIIFVEVKARQDNKFGHPVEAVTLNKRKMIVLDAKIYINRKKLHNRNIRFDVVTMLRGEVEHIEDAFWIN